MRRSRWTFCLLVASVEMAAAHGDSATILAGHSLRPMLKDPSASTPREMSYTVTQKGGGRSIRSKSWCYHQWSDGSAELYDLKNDPPQFTNLASDPEISSKLMPMRTVLAEKRKSLGLVDDVRK